MQLHREAQHAHGNVTSAVFWSYMGFNGYVRGSFVFDNNEMLLGPELLPRVAARILYRLPDSDLRARLPHSPQRIRPR